MLISELTTRTISVFNTRGRDMARHRLIDSAAFGDTDISYSQNVEDGRFTVHWNVDIEQCDTSADKLDGAAGWESYSTEDEARANWQAACDAWETE